MYQVGSRRRSPKGKKRYVSNFCHSLFQYPVGYSIFVKLGGLSNDEQRIALNQMLENKLSTEEAMGVIKTLKQERYVIDFRFILV